MHVSLSYQAQIAFDALSYEDRTRVQRSLDSLRYTLPTQSLKISDETYVLRVTPKLRLLFQVMAEGIEVVDIFTHARLEHLFGSNAVAA